MVLCKEVTLEELDSNLARGKNRSVPGQDRISYHLIKKLPKESKTDLCRIFPDAIRLGYFPKLWKTALVKMIPKPNKDTKYAKSYRPISLLPCIGKLLERILASRLSRFMEENKMFKKSQSGFRRIIGQQNSYFAFRKNPIEHSKTNKQLLLSFWMRKPRSINAGTTVYAIS